MLSPKLLFQKLHKETARQLAVAVEEVWFQQVITFSQAELSSRGLTREQMDGANEFIRVLTTLHLENVAPPAMPDKSLLETFEQPVAEMPKEEK